MSAKNTGLPWNAAASTRSGMAVPGHLPVQASRVSNAASDTHSGAAGVSAERSSPAAAKSGSQLAAPAAAGGSCLSGGRAANRSRRPRGSSTTPTIPDLVAGGSFGVTIPGVIISESKLSGMSGRGLVRYQ